MARIRDDFGQIWNYGSNILHQFKLDPQWFSIIISYQGGSSVIQKYIFLKSSSLTYGKTWKFWFILKIKRYEKFKWWGEVSVLYILDDVRNGKWFTYNLFQWPPKHIGANTMHRSAKSFTYTSELKLLLVVGEIQTRLEFIINAG